MNPRCLGKRVYRRPEEPSAKYGLLVAIILLTLFHWCAHCTPRWVEISAGIKITTCRSDATNVETQSKTYAMSVLCVVSADRWRIENDYSKDAFINRAAYGGTTVYERPLRVGPAPEETQDKASATAAPVRVPLNGRGTDMTIRIWPCSQGHSL